MPKQDSGSGGSIGDRLRVVRLVAWGLVAVALFGLVAISLGYLRTNGLTGGSEPIATIGGPFSLVSSKGTRVTEKDLLGKPTVYFFGFTHCPEVCPTSLLEMGTYLQALGADAEKFNVVFISIDPARDTPEILDNYLSAFDPRIVALTGTQAEIDAVTAAFRVYVRKDTPDPKTGDYNIDHTAALYVMDAKGRFVVPIQYKEDPSTAVAKIRRGLES
jgi:protein SCO1/2